jgi:thiosulfate dehydrogenase [quinone] large subunit
MNGRRVSRKEFLGLGAAIGLISAGAPLLASCGEDLPKVEKGEAIVEEDELEPNSAFVFADADTGEPRVLVRLANGEFAMYSAKCTHRGCTVGYKPEKRQLVCPCHDSKFNPESGAIFGGASDQTLA